MAFRVGGESSVLAVFWPQRALLCAEDAGTGSWWAPALRAARGACFAPPRGKPESLGLGAAVDGMSFAGGWYGGGQERPRYPAWRAILRS